MSSNGRTSTVMASRSASHRSISPKRFANSPGSPASRWRRRWPFSTRATRASRRFAPRRNRSCWPSTALTQETSTGSPNSSPSQKRRTPSARPARRPSRPTRGAVLDVESRWRWRPRPAPEAYRLFLIAHNTGKKGMIITRLFPQKVRERFGLKDLPIVWLSNVGKEDSVRPKDLEKLSLAAEQFLSREKGVVLLDAIEYLVTNNNFLTVLRLVQSIRDQVAVNNGVLLLSVNPSTLDAHQMTLLEREMDQVVNVSGGPTGSTSG